MVATVTVIIMLPVPKPANAVGDTGVPFTGRKWHNTIKGHEETVKIHEGKTND